jgi:hypothetical protein
VSPAAFPTDQPPSPSIQTPTTQSNPVGELGDFTDAAEDVDSYPDFTRLTVSASDTQVYLYLTFRQDPWDLFATIYMYGDSDNEDNIVVESTNLQGGYYEYNWTNTVNGVNVSLSRDEDIGPDTTALISFPRSSMPDLMHKRIWVYSERSNDRMPDDDATQSYFSLSSS